MSNLRCLGVVSISVVAIAVVGAGVWYVLARNTEAQQLRVATTLAQQLGADDTNQIAAYQQCWDVSIPIIMPNSCGVFIHYTTSLSRDELQALIARMGLNQQGVVPADGYGVFAINRDTRHRLTVNGNDGSGLNRLQLPKPAAWQWLLTDASQHRISLTYYDIAATAQPYQLDNQPLRGNIVTLMLRTR